MIKVRAFELGYYPIFGFLAWQEGDSKAIFVDPGGWDDEIIAVMDEEHLQVEAILLTHGHGDHTGGLREAVTNFSAKVYAHAAEEAGLPVAVDYLLLGGESISCGKLNWQAISIPGHTPGSLAYHAGDVLFTGDALFAGSVGGTAGQERYEEELQAIRQQLFHLGDDTRCYPAHGPATLLGVEKRCNPFLR